MHTLLIAATEREFHFRHVAEPIHLQQGDALVFASAELCHKGAANALGGSASVAAHAYVGRELVGYPDSFSCLSLG